MNYRLNIMGINTAEEFNQRLNEEILKRSSKQGELEHAFNLNYIDPTAFSIGPLSIKWYGIIIAVGILIGYFIAQESLKYVGLHKDTLVDVIFYSAIFGFITARIYFVIFQWPYYAQNPFEIPMIWHGGIAIHGGLLGGFITGIIVCKIKNLNPFQIGDIVAPSIILAQGIGRWGNFMNHEAHGVQSQEPFRKFTYSRVYYS